MVCLSNASSVSWQPNCAIGFVGTSSSWVLPKFGSLVALPTVWTRASPMFGWALTIFRVVNLAPSVSAWCCLGWVDQVNGSINNSSIPSRTKANGPSPSQLEVWSLRVGGAAQRPYGHSVNHLPKGLERVKVVFDFFRGSPGIALAIPARNLASATRRTESHPFRVTR